MLVAAVLEAGVARRGGRDGLPARAHLLEPGELGLRLLERDGRPLLRGLGGAQLLDFGLLHLGHVDVRDLGAHPGDQPCRGRRDPSGVVGREVDGRQVRVQQLQGLLVDHLLRVVRELPSG